MSIVIVNIYLHDIEKSCFRLLSLPTNLFMIGLLQKADTGSMLLIHCPKHHRENQGAVSIRKTVLPGMAIPMLKIRRPNGRLIFNMEITICR